MNRLEKKRKTRKKNGKKGTTEGLKSQGAY
jgi:hypothetical protein